MNASNANAARHIAVIAVHGVADQKPRETARTIADVLSRVEDAQGHSVYGAFEEVEIRVPVRAVALAGAGAAAQAAPAASSLFEMKQSKAIREAVTTSAAEPPDHKYTREQLSRYVPDVKDQTFETIRLESARGDQRRVHVYEAYWADLSRLESGILSAVLELYQLMFYVCSLGRKAIGLTRLNNPSRWWSLFAWAHAAVEWPLVLGVPILNLMVLALALVVFTIKIPSDAKSMTLSGLGTLVLAGAVLTALLIYGKRMKFRGSVWPALSLLVLLAAVLVAAAGRSVFGRADSYRALGLMVFVLLAIVVLWLMAEYQRRRLAAFPLACLAVVLTLADFIWQLWTPRPSLSESAALVNAVLRSAEGVLWVLRWTWIVVMAGVVATALTGLAAVYLGTPRERRWEASRAAWTANLSATLPAVMVIVLNLTVWTAIHATGTRMICQVKPSSKAVVSQADCPGFPIAYTPRFSDGPDPITAGDQMVRLLELSAQPLFLIALFAGVAALWAVWSMTPAVVAEFGGARRYPEAAAEWLGDALSSGFRAMRVSQVLLQVLFVILVIGAGIILFGGAGTGLTGSRWAVAALGGLVALGVTVTKGPLKPLAMGFRSALDVALDVTNWLRVHPLERNPRARICARYASLLRHLCRYRDSHGHPYAAIVIIAHSQGTVITADLLRFLNRERGDPDLACLYTDAAPRVYLFTMGCPLRQLYATRFPGLYSWAWHDAPTWPGPRPDPDSLAVTHWTNMYRSGDYVGRYLWFPDTGATRWSQTSQGPRDKRSELCVGAGAHTHYWDQLPPDEVGTELDRLIAAAP
jgi:hypothetical protein